jgi:EAL domain-containing protein (putative c-di-GMP-specific phosphodiesterase class I)
MNSNDFALMVPGIHTRSGYNELGNEMMQTAASITRAHFGDEAESASIYMGIGAYEPEQSIDTTLSHVDHALMQAKMEAPFTCRTFRYDASAADFQNHGKEELIALIRDAVTHDRIRLASQRCVEMRTGKTFHNELFARFHNEKGELIPARHLLPVAHSAGLLEEIDRYLLHKVCKSAPGCAMNLSAPTVAKSRFLKELKTLSNQRKISPRLHFETSLQIVREHPDAVERFSEALRSMHFAFGIDGFVFGSHEAELLKKIRPDYIKINTSYLCGFPARKKHASMLRSLRNLTSGIGIRIIATNVENEEQKNRLLEFGITCMQGFHVHEPELLEL